MEINEFPSQRPVTRNFDVFFDLCLNKLLSKQSGGGDLRRHRAHYDVTFRFPTVINLKKMQCYYVPNIRNRDINERSFSNPRPMTE